jgi:hypothetical protein
MGIVSFIVSWSCMFLFEKIFSSLGIFVGVNDFDGLRYAMYSLCQLTVHAVDAFFPNVLFSRR